MEETLFKSIISATKTYQGTDPLLPWIEGIRKIKRSLPRDVVKEKLPRFIEKCATTFITEDRYRNDLRYLQVWIDLLEFVPDRAQVFAVMERNKIGMKHALFYQAYALHFEKLRRYADAQNVYIVGIKRSAKPIDILQQSCDKFLQRMAARNVRKSKALKASSNAAYSNNKADMDSNLGKEPEGGNENVLPQFAATTVEKGKAHKNTLPEVSVTEINNGSSKIEDCQNFQAGENFCYLPTIDSGSDRKIEMRNARQEICQQLHATELAKHENVGKTFLVPCFESIERMLSDYSDSFKYKVSGDDTVVIRRSVDKAITHYDEEREDACHHGLVDPTINLKEAMVDINDMFGKPLDFIRPRTKEKSQKQSKQHCETVHVLIDDELQDNGFLDQNMASKTSLNSIAMSENDNFYFVFSNPTKDVQADKMQNACLQPMAGKDFSQERQTLMKDAGTCKGTQKRDDLVSGIHKNNTIRCTKMNSKEISSPLSSEDTVIIRKFVESAIDLKNEELEPAYHHGLVEPTITTKEAMQDINDMFLKPLQFNMSKQKSKVVTKPAEYDQMYHDENPTVSSNPTDFSTGDDFEIFIDDDLENESIKNHSRKGSNDPNPLILAPHKPDLSKVSSDSLQRGDKVFTAAGQCSVSTTLSGMEKQISSANKFIAKEVHSEENLGMDPSNKYSLKAKDMTRTLSSNTAFGVSGVNTEQTVATKEVMQDINSIFAKPLQFNKSAGEAKMDSEPSNFVIEPEKNVCTGVMFEVFVDDDFN